MDYTLSEMSRILDLVLEEIEKNKKGESQEGMVKAVKSIKAVRDSLVSRSRKKQMELGL